MEGRKYPMRYKILLFLCMLLMMSTIVCATDNTTQTSEDNLVTHTTVSDVSSTVKEVKTLTKNNNDNSVKSTPASNVYVDDAYGETYYGARIEYQLDSSDVDEGEVELYVNNTSIGRQEVDGWNSFDWTYDYENNEVLDKYPKGQYPIKVVYYNNGSTVESNTASLYISTGPSNIQVNGEIGVSDSKIILPVSVTTTFDLIVDHGTLKAIYDDNTITTIECDGREVLNMELPAAYQQKTITLTYSDNDYMLSDSSKEVFLDVLVPGTGAITTNITVNDAKFINTTHIEDEELIIDSIDILLDVNVTTNDEKVTTGQLTAYHNGKAIATSKNATSITIPAEYNLEEITLNYTGVGDYSNSSTAYTVLLDKISTRTYMSYVSATKNSDANIYPSITSNLPFLYGRIHIYIDDNLVKTIDLEDNNVYVSLNGTRTTVGSNLNLNGFDDGRYTLTVEIEENNVFTSSEYSTSLTINKVNTYIYANNRTIYVGDTSNIYAYVYANNRATINSGMMSFTIDGELIATEYVSNNTANIEYSIPSTLTEGKHTLLLEYMGDDSYNTSQKEITLTLAKTSTTTTLRTWTVENEKIVLNTTVRAWNKTINSGNVNVYIDNTKVATGQVTDNTAAITLPNTVDTDTKYNLRLEYTGTDLLNSNTYSVDEFIFYKKASSTRIYPYLRNNGTLTLTAYVYSDNYAKVNMGNVIFYINNKQVTNAPVTNNKASTTYNMADYDAGNYTIKATYNGSKQFNTSTNTSTVTKNPYYHTTYMSLANNSLTVKRGGSTDINATLTCYSRNITEDIAATIALNATWGTIVYTQDVTFHNGVLNYKFTLPSNFEIFTFYGQEITRYTMTITTQQSKNFKSTGQTGTLQVGTYTKLYQKTLWGYKQANITFNSTLQDTSGKQVNTNTTARIDIYTPTNNGNNLIKSFKTNVTNGKLSYVYQIPSSMTNSTYLVNITALSNKDYAGSYKTVNMTLNNRRTYISASNTYGYIGKTLTLNGTVMDSTTRAKAATSGEVTITVDGKTLTTVKTSKGVFRYTLNNSLTEGKHNITYTYKGDTVYANSTRTLNLTSNKNTLRISAPTISASIGDTIKITATITNTSGATIKDKLKANILLNGKTIATNIDVTGGKLTYNYTIPTGTSYSNKITIKIQETDTYKTRNATTTLTVKKAYQYVNVAATTITTNSGSKIYITGNITDKNKNLISNTKLNIKIAGKEITNISSTNGKFNYEYTVTQNKGTYDITVKALESNSYLYNAKHMTLKVTV